MALSTRYTSVPSRAPQAFVALDGTEATRLFMSTLYTVGQWFITGDYVRDEPLSVATSANTGSSIAQGDLMIVGFPQPGILAAWGYYSGAYQLTTWDVSGTFPTMLDSVPVPVVSGYSAGRPNLCPHHGGAVYLDLYNFSSANWYRADVAADGTITAWTTVLTGSSNVVYTPVAVQVDSETFAIGGGGCRFVHLPTMTWSTSAALPAAAGTSAAYDLAFGAGVSPVDGRVVVYRGSVQIGSTTTGSVKRFYEYELTGGGWVETGAWDAPSPETVKNSNAIRTTTGKTVVMIRRDLGVINGNSAVRYEIYHDVFGTPTAVSDPLESSLGATVRDALIPGPAGSFMLQGSRATYSDTLLTDRYLWQWQVSTVTKRPRLRQYPRSSLRQYPPERSLWRGLRQGPGAFL